MGHGRCVRIVSATVTETRITETRITETRITETRITYEGDPALVAFLVQMLEEEGVEVQWQRPEERRDVRGMAEAVVVNLVAVGVLTGIRAAVQKFRGQFGSRVDVEGEDDEPRGGRHRA
jgi:hypothetical protein